MVVTMHDFDSGVFLKLICSIWEILYVKMVMLGMVIYTKKKANKRVV
jgi:hypothetical protein